MDVEVKIDDFFDTKIIEIATEKKYKIQKCMNAH